MNRIIIGVALIALVGGSILFFQSKKNTTQSTMTQTQQTTSDTPTGSSQTTYSLADVAQHSNADSCWMAIEGKVYDVSPFIKAGQHPGGAEILKGCGIDATELFNNRPGNEGPHSINARDMLKDYYIGDLQ